MISFAATEEQNIARSVVRDFAQKVLRPIARQADENCALDQAALQGAWDLELVQTIAGEPSDMPEQATLLNALLLEELADGDAATAVAIAASLGFAKAIAEQGSDAQKHALLPLFAGRKPCAAAIALVDAPHGGTKAGATATKAAGGYKINGAKAMIPRAQDCVHFLVVVPCEGAQDAFIVPRDAVAIRQNAGTLGLRALNMSDIFLEDVFVPAAMRLGAAAGANIQRIIDSSRVALSAILTGLSRAVFDYALPYTKERVVHGEAIARKQAIAFKLSDMHIDIEAMHWMALRAAAELDEHATSMRGARLAQRYSADGAMWIADEGLQMFGGHGFIRELPLEMWYRNARTLSVLDGLVGA
jgi:alkylation response protein AidB-like acyl-CoA dehydrogenase